MGRGSGVGDGSGSSGQGGNVTMACGGDDVYRIRARGGSGGMWACSGGDGCRSPSLIFLERPLEREFTPFFLQMTARVCGGGVPSPLIELKMGQEGNGPN